MSRRPFSRSPALILPSVLLALSLAALPAQAGTPSGKKLVKRIQKAYDALTTFSCRFRYEFQWALAGEVEVTEGSMELAKPERFRYETPQQVMVTDGKTLWRWNALNRQAIIEPLEEAEPGILPREILFEYPKKFDVTSVREAMIGGKEAWLLELTPKDPKVGVRRVKVWIGAEDSITRRMEFTDLDGNLTTYILRDIRLNEPIGEERFTLQLPEDATVYDLR